MKIWHGIIVMIISILTGLTLNGQPLRDTLQMNFGASSELNIYINSVEDYAVLRSYDIDSLVDVMSSHLRAQEAEVQELNYDADENRKGIQVYLWGEEIINSNKIGDSTYHKKTLNKITYPRHMTFLEFDFGVNNFTSDEALNNLAGDNFNVRNWGSWNFAINSVLKSQFSKTFKVQSSIGVSWYNFKFQDDNTILRELDGQAQFFSDESGRENTKSKLTVAYLNAQMVPMFRLTRYPKIEIGIGGYVGYRLDSYTKNVFSQDGNKEKVRIRDDYFLNKWRYGIRGQFSVSGREMYFNYDLNSLFRKDRGPNLHAISIGIVI